MKSTVAIIALMLAVPSFTFAQGLIGEVDITKNDIKLNFVDKIRLDDDNVVAAGDIIQIFNDFDLGLDLSTDFDNIAGTVMTATAVNTAEIDGSIDLTSVGLSSSTTSSESAASSDNDAGESGSTDLSGSLTGVIYGADFNLTEGVFGSTSSAFENGISNEEMSESVVNVASVQNFGDISSVAAGALNTANFDLKETAGTLMGSSNGTTASTTADAEDNTATGSGLLAVGTSMNSAFIDGSITANLDGGDVVFASVSSVAAGALNTVTLNAEVVGNVAVPSINW